MRVMSRLLSPVLLATLAACGGGRRAPVTVTPPAPQPIGIYPQVAHQAWYRVTTSCAQGPFEVEVPIAGAAYGEEVELRLQTPRKVALQAVVLADEDEVAKAGAVFGATGITDGRADNTRCVADARERLALGRGGGGGGPGSGTPGGPGPGGASGGPGTPPPSGPTPALAIDDRLVTSSIEVVRFRLQDRATATSRIRIRFWSVEPNDVEGVLFGVTRIDWRPNVSDEAWAAHLAAEAERARQEEARAAAEEERRRLDQERRRAELEARRVAEEDQRRLRIQLEIDARAAEQKRIADLRITCRSQPKADGCVEIAGLDRRRLELERERQAAWDAERLRAEEERKQAEARLRVQVEYERTTGARRRRAAEEARRAAEEARRRRELAIALEIEAKTRRERFCATHAEDRGCWGVGGLQVHLEFENRRRQRQEYCGNHPEDARCWTAMDRQRRTSAAQLRIAAAATPPAPPAGPPPAALPETTPPKLSLNATWRPGYWHWIGGQWVWLAGMWRVPESDILAEQTTEAPAAPPPPQAETMPPAPIAATVWIAGFWQWSGTSWVWIPGAWQLRPSATAEWQAPSWRVRGSVHVLVPGAWIRRGSR